MIAPIHEMNTGFQVHVAIVGTHITSISIASDVLKIALFAVEDCVKNERINYFWHYRELRVKGNRLTMSFLVLLLQSEEKKPLRH